MAEQQFTANNSSLFIQPDGPATRPYYVGCHGMEDLEEARGDIDLRFCFDQLGNYKAVGFVKSAPDPISTTFDTYVGLTRDWLEKLDCPATFYLMLRKQGPSRRFCQL